MSCFGPETWPAGSSWNRHQSLAVSLWCAVGRLGDLWGTVVWFLSGESGMCLWFQRIIPTALQFLRAGSYQTTRQTRPGPLLCTLQTPSETSVPPTSAGAAGVHCRALCKDTMIRSIKGLRSRSTRLRDYTKTLLSTSRRRASTQWYMISISLLPFCSASYIVIKTDK